MEKVIEIFSEEREFESSDNVETELYNGFFSNADKTIWLFYVIYHPEKLAVHGLAFEDKRILNCYSIIVQDISTKL